MPEFNWDPDAVTVPKRKQRKDTEPKLDPDIEKVVRSTGGTAKRRTGDLKTIEEGLTQAFGILGMGLSMVNLYDASVIHSNAELLATHWTKVAEQNPKVKKYLLSIMSGGTWAGAISVTFAVSIPILVNHDMVPSELLGMASTMKVTLPPEELKDMAVLGGGSSNGNGEAVE